MRFAATILALATSGSLAFALAVAQADGTDQASPTSQTADAIEEDWELVVASPDVTGVGPQITTVMSPTGDLSKPFVAYDMNYREYPTFTAGGMQIQLWSKKAVVSTSSQGTNQFQTANETVTWTQRMHLADGSIRYSVRNGQSTTWGNFGHTDATNFRVTYNADLTSMAGYDPADTVKNSGVSFQSDRVTSLKLVKVRYYSNGSLYYTDTTSRTLLSH